MNRAKLTTEQRNRCSANIDTLSTEKIVETINAQDMLVAPAVAKEKKHIAAAVDMIVEAFKAGGRLLYVGAGTSGRLGVLDASECPPTFGVPAVMVQGIIAGGRRALVKSVEGAEDNAAAGAAVLEKKRLTQRDVVVGIAACGITPFVHGAVKYAAKKGAATIFVTCAPQALKHIKADVIINPVVGPEVITGSTRLKAGTATKLVFNTLTTASMIKIGKVYDNLMVDLRATNAKLNDRALRIIIAATGLSRQKAAVLLDAANKRVKPAIVMHHKRCDLAAALKILDSSQQSLRKAIGK